MKKKYYLLITAVLLITVSIVGTSLAAISATGGKVQSELAAPTPVSYTHLTLPTKA